MNRTGPRRAHHPGMYTSWRAQTPAVSPPPVPPAALRHKAATPVGADPTPTRPLLPPGCPEAARFRPLALQPASAILGRSRPFAPPVPSPRLAREYQGLPNHFCRRWPKRNALKSVRKSLRDSLIGCHLWRWWWRISPSAPTRQDGSNLITGVCRISP